MTRLDPRHQEMWELLPWYVNGTLRGQELDAVTGHLSTCVECRGEVGRCRDLAAAVRTTPAVAWAPSSERLARVLAGIDAIEAARAGVGGWREWLRALLAPLRELVRGTPGPMRWALAAQGALVVLLLAVMAWQTVLLPGPLYRTLTTGSDQASRGQAQIRVVFAEDITEREIRGLLGGVQGKIVDGPSAIGAYTVEVAVPASAADRIAPVLNVLRTDSKVRLAEPIRSR
jgi:putative zinc finger protein